MNIPQLFIHSPVIGYVGCFQVFVIVNTEVNVLIAICFCKCAVCSAYISGSGIIGLCAMCIFNF